MPVVTIFTQEAPKIGPFEFDAVLEDALESEVVPATYPLEIGADASDHVIIQPKVYTITGAVSNTPLRMGDQTLESLGIGAVSNLFDSSIAAQFSGLLAGFLSGSSETRASATLGALLALQATKQSFDITSGDIALSNMIVLNIRRVRDAATEHGFVFVATLQELPLVATVIRQNEPNNDQLTEGDPSRTQAAPVSSQGEVSTSLLTSETLLADILEFFPV